MFLKTIDGRTYAFRVYWDAATPGTHYWMIVEMTPQPDMASVSSEPIPEEAISRIHRLLERYTGFPNVPAPDRWTETGALRFRVHLTRTPRGTRPRTASNWIKLLEKAIQTEL
jgi:hypothetical protein